MTRSSPHPLALFSLLPYPLDSEQAKAVIANPANKHLTSLLPDGTLVLDVGFHIRGKSSETLAVIGRGVDADIYVEGTSIGKIQCSFELDRETGVVMLHDRSQRHCTQTFGEHAVPFERGRLRKVVVWKRLNTIVGMGGQQCNFVQFQLMWHQDLIKSTKAIEQLRAMVEDRVYNPRLAWTADEAPTEVPSHRETRLHTPGSLVLKVRYDKIDELGSGSFGKVHKVVNVDSGRLMAVKILQRPTKSSELAKWNGSVHYALKREIETLSSMSHPNIVEYIASQGWYETDIEIFMGLGENTFASLIENGADAATVTHLAFHDMLKALDYMACKGVLHRDVKPENILYRTKSPGQYQFQLGDFGTCNRVVHAVTYAGTPIFMAPEVNRNEHQSCKADVWSLFVTVLWALNIGGFRETRFENIIQTRKAISDSFSDKDVSQLKEMAAENPLERASAAQMLVKLFHGEGLSTPRSQVPAISANSVEAPVDKHHKRARGRLELNPKERAPSTNAGIRKRRPTGPVKLPKVLPPARLQISDEFSEQ